jgi:hypothetical protein
MNPRDMTTGEAEAWRAGWRAACEAMAERLYQRGKEWAKDGFPRDAEALWQASDDARAMQPPERPE